MGNLHCQDSERKSLQKSRKFTSCISVVLWEIKIKLGHHMWLIIVVAGYYEIGSTNEGLLLSICYTDDLEGELKDHYNDCYFCAVNTDGFLSKNKHQIVYPNLDSSMRPVPHDRHPGYSSTTS